MIIDIGIMLIIYGKVMIEHKENKFLNLYPKLINVKVGDFVHFKTHNQKCIFKLIRINENATCYMQCVYTPYTNFGIVGKYKFAFLDHIQVCLDFDEKHSKIRFNIDDKVKIIKPSKKLMCDPFGGYVTITSDMVGTVIKPIAFHKKKNRVLVKFYINDEIYHLYFLRKELMLI